MVRCELYIDGLVQYDHQSVSFDFDEINCIVGAEGEGKSNIILLLKTLFRIIDDNVIFPNMNLKSKKYKEISKKDLNVKNFIGSHTNFSLALNIPNIYGIEKLVDVTTSDLI